MTILITGGAGFIGSSLADRLLNNGEKVVVIDNFNNFYDTSFKEKNISINLNNPNYKFYRGDICDGDILEKIFRECEISAVVHLAAYAGVRKSFENPLLYAKNNIGGTINLLEKMIKFNIKKIVFGSSSSVYGNCDADKFSEDLKLSEPISPYAASKLACEQFLYTYSKIYGINTVCLRFFTVYGPKQRPDLAICKFFNLIENNEPIPVYGDGTAIRDYTYIDDIVSGICAAVEYDKTPYEIVNLGGNYPITLSKMIETIENAIGKKAQINRMPMQCGDVIKTVSDISKAKELLNYVPETKFEEGINKYLQWRKNNK